MGRYVIYNGNLHEASENMISHSNRSFRYGDGVFETMRAAFGTIFWDNDHFERMINSARLLKLDLSDSLTCQEFQRQTGYLYSKNHPNGEAARIRYSLFREGGGYYSPDGNQPGFLIESAPLPSPLYTLNPDGIGICIYPDQKKYAGTFSRLKSSSAMIYVMAGLYRQEVKSGDCLILNHLDNIAEAISSNIFIVSNGRLLTPGLDQGCVDGVMRKVIIRLARAQGIEVEETAITPADLAIADEIFLTNAIQGVTWVAGFNKKTYTRKTAENLIRILNEATIAGHTLPGDITKTASG